MAILINITQLEIEMWTVNIIRENVTVQYLLKDDNEVIWDRGEVIFWRTMPTPTDELGNPVPIPENWYQLPPAYALHLNEITQHAETILLPKLA